MLAICRLQMETGVNI